MTDLERWVDTGKERGWTLPEKAAWPFRLPIIRHLRGLYLSIQIEMHYTLWSNLGYVRTGYDEWVLFAILRGLC